MDQMTRSFSEGSVAERHTRRLHTPPNADAALAYLNYEDRACDSYAEALAELLAPAIERYNARQKRRYMRKDPLEYATKLLANNATNGSATVLREYVVQIGNRDTFGVTDDTFDRAHWEEVKSKDPEAASAYALAHLRDATADRDRRQRATDFYVRLAREVERRWPDNVHVVESIVHGDEPDGTQHGNMAIVFLAGGKDKGTYKTGLDTRASSNKALAEMGYAEDLREVGDDGKVHIVTPLEQWEREVRQMMVDLMPEYGFEYVNGDSKGPHVPTRQYVPAKRAEELQRQAADAEDRLIAAGDALDAINEQAEAAASERDRAIDDRRRAERDAQYQRDLARWLGPEGSGVVHNKGMADESHEPSVRQVRAQRADEEAARDKAREEREAEEARRDAAKAEADEAERNRTALAQETEAKRKAAEEKLDRDMAEERKRREKELDQDIAKARAKREQELQHDLDQRYDTITKDLDAQWERATNQFQEATDKAVAAATVGPDTSRLKVADVVAAAVRKVIEAVERLLGHDAAESVRAENDEIVRQALAAALPPAPKMPAKPTVERRRLADFDGPEVDDTPDEPELGG